MINDQNGIQLSVETLMYQKILAQKMATRSNLCLFSNELNLLHEYKVFSRYFNTLYTNLVCFNAEISIDYHFMLKMNQFIFGEKSCPKRSSKPML